MLRKIVCRCKVDMSISAKRHKEMSRLSSTAARSERKKESYYFKDEEPSLHLPKNKLQRRTNTDFACVQVKKKKKRKKLLPCGLLAVRFAPIIVMASHRATTTHKQTDSSIYLGT